jgi:hypothetical protein
MNVENNISSSTITISVSILLVIMTLDIGFNCAMLFTWHWSPGPNDEGFLGTEALREDYSVVMRGQLNSLADPKIWNIMGFVSAAV